MSTQKLPDFNTEFADWYNDIVYRAELVDAAPVRGCMVIRPYGYQMWEEIQKILDKKIKETGHQNASFPLLIPQSFIQKEKEHVAGFSPELAVVTYAGGEKLEEPLIVRPTSETIIHYFFARWLHSWRDLPIKINQWCNVVRWEMRTRPFLRTTEFLWQEGHTAHETREQALEEALLMLEQYRDLITNKLAIPALVGEKSASERFAGADHTYTIESLMPDGKALQMTTSHMISQNFAKSFDMTYQDREGKQAYPYLTSWGATTRLIGALIMTHGDSKGLRLPPAIAPIQVVIVPITKPETSVLVLGVAQNLQIVLSNTSNPWGNTLRVKVDDDDTQRPGAKFYNWEMKGVPVRIELGMRDIENNQIIVANRATGAKETCSLTEAPEAIVKQLVLAQQELYVQAIKRQENLSFTCKKLEDVLEKLESTGGFFYAPWCGDTACEQKLKEHKATIRCIVKNLEENSTHTCFTCDKNAKHEIVFAKSY